MDKTDLIRQVRVGRPTAVTTWSEAAVPVAAPTAAVIVAEGLLYLGHVRVALLVHLLLFAGCLLASAVVRHDATTYHVFLLIPLFRLLNFGLPVLFENTLSWLAVIYGAFLIAAYDVARVRPAVELPSRGDVRKTLTNVPLAVIVTGILASVEYAILRPTALVESWASIDFLVFVVVMVGLVAFSEELLFRGVIQGVLTERIGAYPAIGISAALFGVMHSTHGMFAELGFGVASGLLFGYIYYRTNNLLLVTLVHGAVNVILYGPFIS